MAGAAFNRGSSKQDYETPADFMLAVTGRFGPIDFDLAADEHNRKAAQYFDERQNALYQEWWCRASGWLWLNPPFGHIAPWAEKCAQQADKGAKILFLVPAAVGSNWWREFVHRRAAVWFLNGRIHFDPNNPKWGYPKDCALCVYGPWPSGYDVWHWKEEEACES